MSQRISKDWVEAYFTSGIDVTNRRLFLTEDISGESISNIVKGLYLMEGNTEKKPVELFISSNGGDMEEMFALYDIINTIKCPVHTFAYGKCMSAAPLLLACGDPGHRWVSPHCSFMIHDCWGSLEGTQQKMKIETAYWEKRKTQWIDLLVKHSNKNKAFWSARMSKAEDIYFTAEEALEWGLADQVWSEK